VKTAPLWIPCEGERLFAVVHEPAGSARAGIVFCAPILHEYVRSQRLFALLAQALSEHGYRVLRFDYRGTGDSAGTDESFSLTSASVDAKAAVHHLHAISPELPIIALGVRATADVAASLAREGLVERLWLWQPILDGADYVRQMRKRETLERQSPMRYPQAKLAAAGDAESLMGFPCGAELLSDLQTLVWSDAGIEASRVTLVDSSVRPGAPAHAKFQKLPTALSAWVDELDMARAAVVPIRALADALATGDA
jgi:pimeloyl-ACP methyl ester carboxylesterase